MNCPDCSIAMKPRAKYCGAVIVESCPKCGHSKSQMTGALDFSSLHDYAVMEARFRRVVRKAMIHEGLHDLDQQSDFLNWLIGEDYGRIPYMVNNRSEFIQINHEEPDDWMFRIKDKSRILNIDGNTPVYAALRAAAQVYKSQKLIVGVN